MNPILCYNKKNKVSFLVVDEKTTIKCDGCGRTIELGKQLYRVHSYSKIMPFTIKHYCDTKCMEAHITRDQEETRSCLLTSVMPENVVLISDHPTDMKTGANISVFQACNLESEHTTDNTKIAGRESIEVARIGADVKEMIEEKDKPCKDGVKFLEERKEDNCGS